MNEGPSDSDLLREYTESRSEAAFAALVSRHINTVYSVALRRTGNPHAADEITQVVFIILARKAGRLPSGTVLSGWLYQTTRLTTANYLRTEIRRVRREQVAYLESMGNETDSEIWQEIAPLLEAAMDRLSEKDRNAILLRFFDGKNLNDVATALGVTTAAATMRVNRAVEKLRKIFGKRGIILSAGTLASVVAAHSVHAAPVGLAATATAFAGKGMGAVSTSILAQATLRTMAWLRLKPALFFGLLLLAGSATSASIMAASGYKLNFWNSAASQVDILIVPRTSPDKASVGKIRAGMTLQQVVAELGEPDQRTGNILHYIRFGFSVIPNLGETTVRAVFCGDSNGAVGPMTKAFRGRTQEGVGMGSTRSEVVSAYGQPTSIDHPGGDRESLRYEPAGLSFLLKAGNVVYLTVDF